MELYKKAFNYLLSEILKVDEIDIINAHAEWMTIETTSQTRFTIHERPNEEIYLNVEFASKKNYWYECSSYDITTENEYKKAIDEMILFVKNNI